MEIEGRLVGAMFLLGMSVFLGWVLAIAVYLQLRVRNVWDRPFLRRVGAFPPLAVVWVVACIVAGHFLQPTLGTPDLTSHAHTAALPRILFYLVMLAPPIAVGGTLAAKFFAYIRAGKRTLEEVPIAGVGA